MNLTSPNTAEEVTQIPTLSLGIYGFTKAGKTRYLYELLRTWREESPHSPGANDNAGSTLDSFLYEVGRDIAQYGSPRSTHRTLHDIGVTVSRRGSRKRKYVFRDLRGEEAARDLDDIKALKEGAHISPQIRECDAFFFFFDPSFAEMRPSGDQKNVEGVDERDGGRTNSNVQSEYIELLREHHRTELNRAKLFVAHVLASRQNRYLPIVFIQTHCDAWEKDATIKSLADEWFTQLERVVVDLYQKKLKGHHPDAFVQRSEMCVVISSVRTQEEREKPIECLDRLIEEARTFQKTDRGRAGWWLTGGVAAVLIFACLLIFVVTWNSQASHPIDRQMQAVESLLENRSKDLVDGIKPSIAKAEEFSKELSKLADLSRECEGKDFADKQVHARALLTRATALIDDTVKDLKSDDLDLGESLLAGCDNVPGLENARAAFWKQYRESVATEMGLVIQDCIEAASSAKGTLEAVRAKLVKLRGAVEDNAVTGKEKVDLIAGMQEAAVFVDARLENNSYEATFSVEPIEINDQAPHALHELIIDPSADGKFGLEETGSRKGTLQTKKKSYPVQLGLGSPIRVRLMYHRGEFDWLEVGSFAIGDDTSPLDTLACLGMPVIRKGEQEYCRVCVPQTAEYSPIRIRFSSFPDTPSLLWEAVGKFNELRDK